MDKDPRMDAAGWTFGMVADTQSKFTSLFLLDPCHWCTDILSHKWVQAHHWMYILSWQQTDPEWILSWKMASFCHLGDCKVVGHRYSFKSIDLYNIVTHGGKLYACLVGYWSDDSHCSLQDGLLQVNLGGGGSQWWTRVLLRCMDVCCIMVCKWAWCQGELHRLYKMRMMSVSMFLTCKKGSFQLISHVQIFAALFYTFPDYVPPLWMNKFWALNDELFIKFMLHHLSFARALICKNPTHSTAITSKHSYSNFNLQPVH